MFFQWEKYADCWLKNILSERACVYEWIMSSTLFFSSLEAFWLLFWNKFIFLIGSICLLIFKALQCAL